MNANLYPKNHSPDAKLKLLLYTAMPASEGAWSAGFEAVCTDLQIDDNPFEPDDPEFKCWENGWWAGFYEEDVLTAELLDELKQYHSMESKVANNLASSADNHENQRALKIKHGNLVNLKKYLLILSAIAASIIGLGLLLTD